MFIILSAIDFGNDFFQFFLFNPLIRPVGHLLPEGEGTTREI